MNRSLLLFSAFLSCLLLSGCLVTHQQAYYVSPFNGNASDYHPLPMKSDSAHTAVYARTAYFTGYANDNHTDHINGGNAAIYVAHHSGMIQSYYGLNLSMGSYRVGKWDSGYQGLDLRTRLLPPAQAKELEAFVGGKLFGGTAFNGGINLVVPIGTGEWRFLGVETSLYREFGDYLSFRRKLPDTLATLDVRSRFFGTAGITTEWVDRTKHGEKGLRLAGGWVLGSAYHGLNIYDSVGKAALRYSYFNASVHYTYERYTGYAQVDAGTKGTTFHFGFVYRMSRPCVPLRPMTPSRIPKR